MATLRHGATRPHCALNAWRLRLSGVGCARPQRKLCSLTQGSPSCLIWSVFGLRLLQLHNIMVPRKIVDSSVLLIVMLSVALA